MEIHCDVSLSDFLFGMKKGAFAPFSCEITISSDVLMLLQAFSCRSPC